MKGRTAIIVLIVVMAALVGSAAAADETPVVPQEFSGTVTIDGNPAPAGTVIEASIDGTAYGTLTTDTKGVFGGVEKDDDRLVVKGGGDVVGRTITFTVNGNKAAQTAVFEPGELGNLALAVKTGGTPGGNTGSGGGGGGGSPSNPAPVKTVAPSLEAPAAPVVGSTTLATSATGTVDEPAAVVSSDRIATLSVPEGTAAHNSEGTPLDEITIRPAAPGEVPDAAGEETGFVAAGYTYLCGPAGATFDPAITLTFEIPAEKWKDLKEGDLTVRWYNAEAGRWEEIPTTIDYETMTVTAEVSHFSTFALFTAAQPPSAGDADRPAAQVTDATSVDATGGETTDRTLPIVAGVLLIVGIAGAAIYLKKK
ncbi:hypothetical protein E2N92_12550 [Methanofollis formosanus]|uniref:PGF-pre-PGF domain-containing protein n=1 Tax=Methanofollis formosanus TaxID=299308 RepID=A0A8G1A4B8_9EURY|nr:hypothetical protein [Methanofollis formosanus]QYZ80201.1 hypothetical protein E2N92_12550 [Methanofollis formosanus]